MPRIHTLKVFSLSIENNLFRVSILVMLSVLCLWKVRWVQIICIHRRQNQRSLHRLCPHYQKFNDFDVFQFHPAIQSTVRLQNTPQTICISPDPETRGIFPKPQYRRDRTSTISWCTQLVIRPRLLIPEPFPVGILAAGHASVSLLIPLFRAP